MIALSAAAIPVAAARAERPWAIKDGAAELVELIPISVPFAESGRVTPFEDAPTHGGNGRGARACTLITSPATQNWPREAQKRGRRLRAKDDAAAAAILAVA